MMMDIYEDLDNFDMGETISELKKENDKLTEKVDELIKKLETTVEDLEKVKKENLILSQNISKLFNTAKADYDRRSRIIADLTKQIDDLVFKRNQAGQNYRIPKRKAEPEQDSTVLPESKKRKFEPVQQKENKLSTLKEKAQNENKNKHKESNNTKIESREQDKSDKSHKDQNRKETTDKRRSRSLSRERKSDRHRTSCDKDRNRRSPELRSKIDRKSKPENLDDSFALEQKKLLEMINKKKSRQNDIESISIHSSSSSEGLIKDKRSIEHKTTSDHKSRTERKKKDDTKATKREEKGKETQRGQGTEDRGKRVEDRRKRAEDRGKRAEDRGKRTRKGETRKERDVNKKNERDGKKKDDKEVTEKEKTNTKDREKDKSVKENVEMTTIRPDKKIERTRNLEDLEEGEITDDENELSLIQHEINVTSKERSPIEDRAIDSRRPSAVSASNAKPDKLDPDTNEKNKERCPKTKQEDLKKPDVDVSNKNLDNETKNVPEAKYPKPSEIKVTIAKIDIKTKALVKSNNEALSDRPQSNSNENMVIQDKPVNSETVLKTEIIVKSIETEKSIDGSSICKSVNKESTDNVSVNPISSVGEDTKSEDKENSANQNICQMTTPAIRPKPKRPRCRILNS